MPLFVFFILYFLNLIHPGRVNALAPVIIDKAEHTYPKESGKDQNYIPSDPRQVNTVPIEYTITIDQGFSPEEIGSSEGNPIYSHQTIDEIQEKINKRETNTLFYRQNFYHFSKPVDNPLDDPEKIKSSLTNYSLSNSSNALRRSLAANVQECLISNQISDIKTFIKGGNSVCIDREINTSKGKVRVGEIINYLVKHGKSKIFYPDTNCPGNQKPVDLPGDVIEALDSRKYSYKLSTAEYLQLYTYGIEPVCDNSLAQELEHCDLNDKGEKLNCKKEIRSGALSASTAQKNIYQNYLPANAEIIDKNYGERKDSPAINDKPNPVSWLAQFFKLFWDAILDTNKNFNGPHWVSTKIDERQYMGLKTHETLMLNTIPQKEIDKDKLTELPASGTNGVTLDPGKSNESLRYKFTQQLQPAAWQ